MKRAYFFTAPWCAACPAVKVRWMKAVRKYPDVERHAVDMTTDEGRAMAKQYGFRGVPTILLLNADGSTHEMFANPGTMTETDFDTKLFHWMEGAK